MLSSEKKILALPLKIAVAIIIVGSLFVIQHWPYGRVIVASGFFSVFILYPIRFYAKTEKKFNDYVKLIFVCFWSLNGIFTILHLPYKIIFQSISSAAFVVWVCTEGVFYFRDNKSRTNISLISSLIFGLATIFVLIGVAFNIMHWPGAGVLLGVGMLLGIIWVFKDLLFKK